MLNVLLKLKNKKGFTMIEMIVVLVIIAILAAAAIPTLIGYVNQARDSEYMTEARVTFNAASTALTEMAAMGHSALSAATGNNVTSAVLGHDRYKEVVNNSGISGNATKIIANSNGVITELEYVTGSGSSKRTVTIDPASGTSLKRG